MHDFTSFYYKELLQKMQMSIFEKYIPLHGLQRNNADKRHGPIWYHHPTLNTPNGLKAKVINPNVLLQFLPSYRPLLVTADSTHLPKKDKPLSQSANLRLPSYRKPMLSIVTG